MGSVLPEGAASKDTIGGCPSVVSGAGCASCLRAKPCGAATSVSPRVVVGRCAAAGQCQPSALPAWVRPGVGSVRVTEEAGGAPPAKLGGGGKIAPSGGAGSWPVGCPSPSPAAVGPVSTVRSAATGRGRDATARIAPTSPTGGPATSTAGADAKPGVTVGTGRPGVLLTRIAATSSARGAMWGAARGATPSPAGSTNGAAPGVADVTGGSFVISARIAARSSARGGGTSAEGPGAGAAPDVTVGKGGSCIICARMAAKSPASVGGSSGSAPDRRVCGRETSAKDGTMTHR